MKRVCCTKMNDYASHRFSKSFAHGSLNDDIITCSTDDPTLVYADIDSPTEPSDITNTANLRPRAISSSFLQDEDDSTGIQECREKHTPSLYTRLKSLFQHKDKPEPVVLLTPPASPQNYRPPILSATPLLLPHEQPHTSMTEDSPLKNISEDREMNLPQWTPLTPESIDQCRTRGPGSLPSLVRLVEDLASSEEGPDIADQLASEQGVTGGGQQLLHDLEEATCAQLDGVGSQGLCLELGHHLPERTEAISLKQGEFSDHGEGVHLREEEHWPGRFRTQSVRQWGKSRAPPIRWDILIEDLSSAVMPGFESTLDIHGRRGGAVHSAHYPCEPFVGVGGDEEIFYGLQYALELSRRDRRKIMDWELDSAGEYSKSREAWATLHLDRVMPAHQEYWFRYWLQWHSRLDDKAAFKLDRYRKKEEYKRYYLIEPWPTFDRRTARHPRRADEDLHPNLRLIRHRTRSAPGLIRSAWVDTVPV